MPITKQAIKRVRQAEKNRKHNRSRRSKMRELIKEVYDQNDKAEAEKALKEAVSYIDRMTVKGIIHKNNAARKKSQLTNYVNNL
ncbi:30S ribosomal protein S20 [Gracilimonas mengyeensis]|uniref:Small ribosomal subunit protein bS20 n=1 Tax=Gracilimonas mengyeensis TaxID=1302730 RepID=A0A521DS80_9BACT|nr:30S ribosomal protein S20 [Gracilimonas mengyeensis]SMO74478.1 SSU ribosomal protein S20P [Gracilimonas mengyeensis]